MLISWMEGEIIIEKHLSRKPAGIEAPSSCWTGSGHVPAQAPEQGVTAPVFAMGSVAWTLVAFRNRV